MKKFLFLLFAVNSLSASSEADAAPIGDNLSTAIDLGTASVGSSFSPSGNSTSFTNQWPDSDGNDVFYKITTSAASKFTASLCGAAFNTYLYLLASDGTIIVSNDNSCGTASKVQHCNLPAATYYLVVDGATAASMGAFTLSITLAAPKSQPIAKFDLIPALGCTVPQNVSFIDQSIIPDTWSWKFGDGGTSTSQNPIHSFTTAGVFTVILMVQDTNSGCFSSASKVVTVDAPTPDFSGSSLFGCAPITTTFTDNSSAPGGSIVSWSWDFGDGGTSNQQNPPHTYSKPGTYTVALTTTTSNGCTNTKTRTNYIQTIGPDVDFGVNVNTGCAPLTVHFSDNTTDGSPITSWLWTFGDGTTSAQQNPTKSYTTQGVFDVSLKVSDLGGCSRTVTKTSVINTIDITPPGITCPGNQAVSFDATCQFTLPDYTALATANDNCGTPIVTQSPAVGTLISTTQTITLTATDGNGNTAQCTFDVIPADNTNPGITCPGNQNVNFDATCQFTLPDYTSLATATDNCSTPIVTQSPAAGTLISSTQTITLTATDGNGNTAQCTFDVIPADNINPVITCPGNQNVNFDAACQFTLPDYTGLATATDNCSTPTVTQSPAAGTLISTTQTITLTATDGNGNTAQCTFDVIPADNTNPVITCPGNQNANFDSSCQFTLPDYTSLATATDNCSTPTVIQSPAAGTLISTTQTITLTATDGNGNMAQCTFDVIPADNTNPVITCPGNQNVNFDATCQFTLADYTGLATATDNCSTPIVTQSPAAGTLISATQTITLTATDGNGNTAQCTFDVIPADNINPVITCPGNQNVNFDAACQFTLPDYAGLATATDNCSTPIVTQSPAAGTLISTTQTITLTATDGNGNTDQCTFDVIPADNTNPAINCPGNQNVSFDGSCQFTLPDYTGLANATDNCSTPTVIQSPAAGTLISTTQTITLTATDGNGNTDQCTFDVIPADNTNPGITCPGNQNVSFDGSCQFTLADYTSLAAATDNCSTPTVIQSPAAGTLISATQTITLTATDGNGNTAQCTFDVIPADNTIPIIICPGNQNANFDAACQFTLPDYTGLATATDNCGTPTVTQSPVSGTIISGTQTVTLTATDGNGNTAVCTFDVIVSDVIPPTIVCPSDVESCSEIISFDEPVAGDNCTGITVALTAGLPSGASFPVGTTVNTYTVTDGGGNTATCSFNVTRFATPVVDVGLDQTVEAGFRYQLDANVNMPVTYEWTPTAGLDNAFIEDPIAVPQQTTTYTLTITTIDGCKASDEIMITVNEEIEINNFMSPNGDGKNDTWEIKGNWLLNGCQVKIFTRQGHVIRQGNGYNNDWDGTDEGKDLPAGNYYYTVSCPGKTAHSGSITLIR